jgi:uncharacterized protein YceK
MKIKLLVTTLLAVTTLAFLTGCAAVVVGGAAGAGTYAYIKGELKTTESATLDRAWSATQGAIKDLQFSTTSQAKDALQARLVARTAMDKKIEVQLTKVSDSLTEIRIRVGTFGDEDLSRTILHQIQKRL